MGRPLGGVENAVGAAQGDVAVDGEKADEQGGHLVRQDVEKAGHLVWVGRTDCRYSFQSSQQLDLKQRYSSIFNQGN